jgi:DNA-binding GntR family transcriptional regulator
MTPHRNGASVPPGGRVITRRTGAREEAGTGYYSRICWPHITEPAVRPGLDSRTAVASRRNVMLATLRSEDRTSLAQQIFDETAVAIVEGRLCPGQTLNSVELAKRFATSRTPVREALVELERYGAIVVAPHQRPRVARANLAQLRDIYELRASLFTLASEIIVDSCPASRLAELWTWQAALEDDAARGSVDDFFWHHAGFRLVESRLTDNDELQRIISSLALRAMQVTHESFSLPNRLERSVADHRRLLLAYEEGDKETAIAVNRLMIMTGYRALQESRLVEDGPRSEPSGGWHRQPGGGRHETAAGTRPTKGT